MIRQNVAATFPLSSLSGKELVLLDPWKYLFDLAKARYPGRNDLIPYWIFEDGGHKVIRQVPALPLSRDIEQLEDLRKTVVAYRMVLGQPRQQDLVSYLESRLRRGLNAQDLAKYRIDLSPSPMQTE